MFLGYQLTRDFSEGGNLNISCTFRRSEHRALGPFVRMKLKLMRYVSFRTLLKSIRISMTNAIVGNRLLQFEWFSYFTFWMIIIIIIRMLDGLGRGDFFLPGTLTDYNLLIWLGPRQSGFVCHFVHFSNTKSVIFINILPPFTCNVATSSQWLVIPIFHCLSQSENLKLFLPK